jgi:excisionase family DNA binding protein
VHSRRDDVPGLRQAVRCGDYQQELMMNVTEHSLQIFGAAGSRQRPEEWTVSQYAEVEQVDRKTVLRWIAKGALVVRRTPGGHFRIKGTR